MRPVNLNRTPTQLTLYDYNIITLNWTQQNHFTYVLNHKRIVEIVGDHNAVLDSTRKRFQNDLQTLQIHRLLWPLIYLNKSVSYSRH